MRLITLEQTVIEPTGPNTAKLLRFPCTVNLDQITSYRPYPIPGDLKDAQGGQIPVVGTAIHLGGDRILTRLATEDLEKIIQSLFETGKMPEPDQTPSTPAKEPSPETGPDGVIKFPGRPVQNSSRGPEE